MSTDFETNADKCAPRNVLFCCRSPIYLNNRPKLVPVTNNLLDSQFSNQPTIYPICVPDLSDTELDTNFIIQPRTSCEEMQKKNCSILNFQPPIMHQINKSESAQDVRHYGVNLRRVTPPKCTVSVKKNDNPMMNVVLRKVLIIIAHIHLTIISH